MANIKITGLRNEIDRYLPVVRQALDSHGADCLVSDEVVLDERMPGVVQVTLVTKG